MISVIVPVYNAEKWLALCIESILNQDYGDIELILVNDGSLDCSLDICCSFSDERIRVIDKPNGGVSSARNTGLESAMGEYVAFVDSDDTLPKDALSLLIAELTNATADMSIGSFMFQYGNRFQKHASRLSGGIYSFESLLPEFIDDGTFSGFLLGSVWGALYKTSIIKQNSLLFNCEIKNNEDGLFNFEYALKSKTLAVTSKCVYYYRQYMTSSTSKRKITYDFNTLIKRDVTALVDDVRNYDLDIQFKKRSVSLALWDILKYPSKMNIVEGVAFIRKRINTNEVREGLNFINVPRLPRHKKIFYYLIKYRLSITIFMFVKYLIPRIRAHVSR